MIQDIAPHRFDRSYSLKAAEAEDIALCYQKGQVLLRRQGDTWALPYFKDLPAADLAASRHVFALDGIGCYLCPWPEEIPAELEAVSFQTVRSVRPMEVAFAAITGAQLWRWYDTRRFCGRCGHAMEPSTIERAMVCPDCGLIEYPKISPVILVAIRNGDKLLVTRYANRPYTGWALVAGFVEIGETLEDTVRREVMEEVGLRIKNIRYYKNQPWSFTDTLLSGFWCDLDGDDTVTLEEAELKEAFWLSREELPVRKDEISLTAEMMEQFRLGLDPGRREI